MTMLWGRTGQKGFPRERLGRRPAVLGFYAWQYSGCPMKAGNLSESEGSDAFWVPLYSSIYLRESHVQGNRFDLENPGQDGWATGTPCQEAGVSACRSAGDEGNADRDIGTDQPASAGTWLAFFGRTGIKNSYGSTRVNRLPRGRRSGRGRQFWTFTLVRGVVTL